MSIKDTLKTIRFARNADYLLIFDATKFDSEEIKQVIVDMMKDKNDESKPKLVGFIACQGSVRDALKLLKTPKDKDKKDKDKKDKDKLKPL